MLRWLVLCSAVVLGGCTPEAHWVSEDGRTLEADKLEIVEAATQADGGPAECGETQSLDDDCNDCLRNSCGPEWRACNDERDVCVCGTWAGMIGQSSCIFQCDPLRPREVSLRDCFDKCGVSGEPSPRTLALIECASFEREGQPPPRCKECFTPPGGTGSPP